jgi:DHA1 family tetracycline resistance protein-like MFS transporter
MLFILIAVLIDTIGFGIVAPVTPELIMELTGQPISEAALYGGWLMFLYALTQFFAAPILGNLSDRFGRRPFSFKRANPIGALAQMRKYPGVLMLFGALVFYQLAHDANPSTWTYYTMLKFGWSERDVGLSMGVLGITIVVVQGLLILIVIPKLGAA